MTAPHLYRGKCVHALMRAHGLVLARDSEPGEPARGHVVVPEPNRRIATDLTTVWTRKGRRRRRGADHRLR